MWLSGVAVKTSVLHVKDPWFDTVRIRKTHPQRVISWCTSPDCWEVCLMKSIRCKICAKSDIWIILLW